MNHQSDLKVVSIVNFTFEEQSEVSIEKWLGFEALTDAITYINEEHIEEYGELVFALDRLEYSHLTPKKLD